MAAPNPNLAGTSQTKASNKGGLTALECTLPRKVTYVFNAGDLANIPFAVAVDGVVLADFAQRSKLVSGKGGKVDVTVCQGQRVSLYLNSDAAAAWRQNPVYAVTAGERDIVVKIVEKKGKHSDADTPVPQAATAGKATTAGDVDHYTAPLTGDIWMKVSHKYTESEVDTRLPAGTSDAVKAAVKSIYSGLGSANLEVTEPASAGQPARRVKVTFEDADNPRDNITQYALLADGLPRVHPSGYAALLSAALDNGITSLRVSSCWRPMLGQIPHRVGLGLDVSILGGTVLNREELRKAFEIKAMGGQGDGDDGDNVSNAEVQAFGEYEQAISAREAATVELADAGKALNAVDKTNAQALKAAEELVAEKREALRVAQMLRNEKLNSWSAARDATEPTHVRGYRQSLMTCACVRQIFDPWFIDDNVKDSTAPEPNMQRGVKNKSNERLHAHHLHITVADPKIL